MRVSIDELEDLLSQASKRLAELMEGDAGGMLLAVTKPFARKLRRASTATPMHGERRPLGSCVWLWACRNRRCCPDVGTHDPKGAERDV